MIQIDVFEAQSQFLEIIERILRGEEVIIAQNEEPVIKMIAIEKPKKQRKFGSAKGMIILADDFDEPLEDFAKYM
ncbi:MAG: DUF2281 domain-containing protein [Chloroflexota bacterium]